MLRSTGAAFIDRLLAQRVLCAASGSGCGPAGLAHAGLQTQTQLSPSPFHDASRRSYSSGNGGEEGRGGSGSQSSAEEQRGVQQSQPQAPGTQRRLSPAAAAAAEVKRLKQASPTGRLLDLFVRDDAGSAGADQALGSPLSPRGRPRLPRGSSPTDTMSAAAATVTQASAEPGAPPQDMVRVVHAAVENCKPLMHVLAIKKGTKVVYVPRPIPPKKQAQLAVKWIVEAAHKRKAGSTAKMHECLALELLLAFQKKGAARAKRDELHKLALDNRANVFAGAR